MASIVIPKLQIYNEDNTNVQDTWNVGTLDLASADNHESNVLVINVWNNRGGNSDVPDLVGCKIATRSVNGDLINCQVVTGQWVQACVDSTASIDPSTGQKIFSAIGADSLGREIACDVAHQGASGDDKTNCIIKGTANNGEPTVAIDNYSKISLKVKPPTNAEAKVHYFKTRISGYYI